MCYSLSQSADVRKNDAQVFRTVDSHAVFANRQELSLLKVFIVVRLNSGHLAEGSDKRSRLTRLGREEDIGNTSRNRQGVDSFRNTTLQVIRHVTIKTTDAKSELEARHKTFASHHVKFRNRRQEGLDVRQAFD